MQNPYDDNLDEGPMSDDTAGGNGLDPDYEDDPSVGAAPARVGSEPIPGFAYYVVQLGEATPGFEFDDKARPEVRHRGTVVEGPEGTIGQTFFAGQRLYVSEEKWTEEKDADGKPVFQPKSADELAKDRKTFKAIMARVQAATGIANRYPAGKDLAQLAEYGAQFKETPLVVIEVKRSNRKGYVKNTVYWDSLRGVNEPALDKANGKTALDEARKKIAAKNKALGKKPTSGAARTATSTPTTQAID